MSYWQKNTEHKTKMEEYQRRSRMGLISPMRNQKLDVGRLWRQTRMNGPPSKLGLPNNLSPNGSLANGIPLLLRNQNRTTCGLFFVFGVCAGRAILASFFQQLIVHPPPRLRPKT